ncbi:MAG TPA: outer membrane protein assembly factor BamA [Spirochaetota bacterium]|nr:outer membrane protein assembly factor BamA [Spirochaetota bacterium]
MKKIWILCTLLGLIMFISGPFRGLYSQTSRYEGKTVKKIQFTGLKNVDELDLLDVIVTEEGYPLRAKEVRKDIQSVFREGQFENVVVEVDEYRDGVAVRFKCKERPIIKDIVFLGTEEVNEMELTNLLLVKENDALRRDLIEKSVKLIRKKYDDEGFFNAVVKYDVNEIPRDPNSVKLTFRVDEGEEIRIEKISILGTNVISDKTLRSIMETDETGIFGGGGQFKQDIYAQDKMKIVAYYKQEGYLDAQILEDNVNYEWENPEEKENRAIFITIRVTEGEKYYFDKYTVEGHKIFDSKVFFDNFEQRDTGDVFNNTSFQKDMQMIASRYAQKGYIFARVIPNKSVREMAVEVNGRKEIRKLVRIDFKIREGQKVRIENIIIKGNKKTKDRVVRRELMVHEGELFDSYRVQRSRERVFNLGFFKEVNVNVRPGSREGLVNLIVEVEEQPTGTISLGGGYGTTSGFSIFADVGENNLMGNGQNVGVRFEYGPYRRSVTLRFQDPWIADTLFDNSMPLGFNASVFYQLNTIPTTSMFSNSSGRAYYDRQTIGYSLGLYYRFWDFWGVGSNWGHAFRSYINPTGNCSDDVFIQESRGTQEKRTVSFYLYRNSKDNYMNPTRGIYTKFTVAFTGGYLLRGDDHYIKYSPDIYMYYSPFNLPFLRTHPVVFELRGNADFMRPPLQRDKVQAMQDSTDNPWIEPEDRLRIGGPETLRGWDYYDSDFPDSWRIGLFHRILYGAEFRIPIHPQMLWFIFFFDAGSVWTDSFWEPGLIEEYQDEIAEDRSTGMVHDIREFRDINLMSYFRYSYGFGFKIQIPMMPLRFWFGRKLIWSGRDNGYFKPISDFNFQFGIGDMRF